MWGLLGALIFSSFIILMLLIIGQLFYKNYPKTAYFIWGFTILLLGYCVYSFNTTNTRLGDQGSEKYTGNYKLDIYNSNYDGVNISDYYNLNLTVKKDHTFEFSKDTPFFDTTIGHWQHMDDGDINWTEISIGDENLSQAQIETEEWKFLGRNLKNGKRGNIITFKRQ